MLKFFERFLVLILYVLSHFFPRNKKIWVYGSYGVFNDNSRYLFLSTPKTDGIRKIWISKTLTEKALLEELGYESYLKYSFNGIWYCLRAKVYIYSCYISDINYFTSGSAIAINLWHGIPLKKIEFDINDGNIAHIFNKSLKSKFYFPHVYRRHNYILSPSNFVTEYSFKNAFRSDGGNVIDATYPRLNSLINSAEVISDKTIFFYAPTWRDGKPNFLEDEYFNLRVINDFCESRNIFLYIKLHPASKIKINNEKFKNIVVIENNIDSNYVMKLSSCLITDYSSIYFDYLALNKPIIFYRFDEAEYLEKSREFYNEIYDFIPGSNTRTLDELLKEMHSIHESKFKISNEQYYLLKEKLNMGEYKPDKYLYDKILKIVNGLI